MLQYLNVELSQLIGRWVKKANNKCRKQSIKQSLYIPNKWMEKAKKKLQINTKHILLFYFAYEFKNTFL